MAFSRKANAVVVHPRMSTLAWQSVRTAATRHNASLNLAAQASEILGEPFDPNRYLLTHATIVASVDVEDVPGVKTGSVQEQGKTINRKYANFRITPDTEQYINNNFDCFPRDVLMKAYKTFKGAHNFCEHVQVEALSKGRIIDAVARDIGDSIYVDILVATDRKHADLVQSIEAGQMTTLSMGASVAHTTCTLCGNVAADETELCEHIKYSKGDTFIDDRGKRRMIAEICGHVTDEPNGGVTFIEASWVANPAFKGAVLRNIIDPGDLSDSVKKQAQEVLSSAPANWVNDLYHSRAARKVAFDFSEVEEGGDAESPAETKEKPKNIFDSLTDDVIDNITDRVRKKIRKEMEENEPSTPDVMAPNDTLQREALLKKTASMVRHAYSVAVKSSLEVASGRVDLMRRVANLDREFGFTVSKDIYQTALQVGSVRQYGDDRRFLAACRGVVKREMSQSEVATLLRLGRLLSHLPPSK